jgi:hypothetical protein
VFKESPHQGIKHGRVFKAIGQPANTLLFSSLVEDLLLHAIDAIGLDFVLQHILATSRSTTTIKIKHKTSQHKQYSSMHFTII